MAGKTSTLPSVDDLIASIVDNDLAGYLEDKDTAARIITWVAEETGLPRLGVRLAYNWLTPLALAQVKSASRSMAHSAVGKLTQRLSLLPGYAKLADAIVRLNGKLARETAEREVLDGILKGERSPMDAADLATLAFDQKLAFKQLCAIADLDSELRAGFAKLLERVSPQPLLVLDVVERTAGNRNFYGAQRTPFVERQQELAALETFLQADATFTWWKMQGPTGIGKRRLALQLCLRNATSWRAGVLPREAGFDREWATWQPERPTLLILHGETRSDEVDAIVAILAQRGDDLDWPVRLLHTTLYDQETQSFVPSQLISDDRRDQYIRASRYDGFLLALGGLSKDGLWACLQSVVLNCGLAVMPQRKASLKALRRIDPLGRPLFAAFGAEAIADDRDVTQLDSVALMNDVLVRETAAWDAAGVSELDRNLLALATITDGLDLRVLLQPPEPDVLPAPAAFDPARYRLMSGQPAQSQLGAMQPDVLGHVFVLQHLMPRHALDQRAKSVARLARTVDPALITGLRTGDQADTPADAEPERLMVLAGREARFMQFFTAAGQAAPGHATLFSLRQSEPAPELAFSWVVHTGNLINRLDQDGNLSLCAALFRDLLGYVLADHQEARQIAGMHAKQAAIRLLIRYVNVPAMDDALGVYADLERLHEIDEELVGDDDLSDLRGMLVVGFANANELDKARSQYDVMLAASNAAAGGRTAFTLTLAATKLLRGYLRNGELVQGRALYEDICGHASALSADAVRKRGSALAALVVAHARADENDAAQGFFDELTQLRESREAAVVQISNQPAPADQIGQAFIGLILGTFGVRSNVPVSAARETRELQQSLRKAWVEGGTEIMIGLFDANEVDGGAHMYANLKNLPALEASEPAAASLAYAAIKLILPLAALPQARTVTLEAFDDLLNLHNGMREPGEVSVYVAQGAYWLVRELLQQDARAQAETVAQIAAPILRSPGLVALIEKNEGEEAARLFFTFVAEAEAASS